MYEFLIYLIIALAVVTVAHLMRIIELNARLREGNDDEVMTEKENRFNGQLMLIFLLSFFAFVVWLTVDTWEMLLPAPASEHGADIDTMLGVNFIIIFIVFVLTNLLLFFFAFRYYGRKNGKALYYPHNSRLEILWTVVPTIFLAVLITYGLFVWNKITNTDDLPDDVLKVEVYAKQFDWTARYPGADNEFGDADFRLIDGPNVLGMDSTDEKGWDDKIVRELHLPVGRKVQMSFRARDVIHSAYLPHFRVQMNCVPGMTTQFVFTPTITTEEMRKDPFVINKYGKINALRREGGKDEAGFDYILLCNKICGAAHSNMQMKVIVESEEDYRRWLDEQKVFVSEKKDGMKQGSEKIAEKL